MSEFNASDYLQTDEDIMEFLNAALEENDNETFLLALRSVAQAKGGIKKLADITGLNRESLYKVMSAKGNPHYETMNSIVNGLGYQFSVVPKSA